MRGTGIALRWGIVWGLVGASTAWTVHPDTSHVSTFGFGVIVGIIGAAFGALAGLIFRTLIIRFSFVRRFGLTGPLLLGIAVGALVGVAAWFTMIRTLWTIVIAAFLGGVLGFAWKNCVPDPDGADGPTA